MNRKQRKNKLQANNKNDFRQIPRKEYVFRFTEQYIRKKKIQRYTTLIFVPIGMVLNFPLLGLIWDRGRFVGLLGVVYILTLAAILLRYGINRIYGDDLRIENNQLVYHVTYSGSRGRFWSAFVFALIEKVEIKRNKIVIHGKIVEESRYGRVLKKMALPKEIENVDEFIRLVQSMVV